MRFIFIFLGYIAGFFGIGLGIFVYLCILTNLKSFGVPYMAPYAPATHENLDSYFLKPIWRREKRADFLNTKKQRAQKHISMKWRYK